MRKWLLFFMVAAFVVALWAPAMAQEKAVSLYGHVRFNTWYDNIENAQTLDNGTKEDDGDLQWELNEGTTRFGANFKQGDLSGHVELRPNSNSITRIWSATWDFGAGKMLVGQDYAPSFKPYGVSSREGTGSYGDTGATVRVPEIQVSFPLGPGELKIAGIKTNDPGAIQPATGGTGQADTDIIFPKFEAAYDVWIGPVHLYPYGGWQQVTDVNSANNEIDVSSWTIGSYASVGFGAFTLNGGAFYAQNYKEYGNGAGLLSVSLDANNNLLDTNTWGAGLTAVWVINDMFRLEGGYHYLDNTADDIAAGTSEQTRSMYYLNAPIYVTKNITITPEVGKKDNGTTTTRAANGTETDSDTDGSDTYFGARWVLTF